MRRPFCTAEVPADMLSSASGRWETCTTEH